MHVPGNIEVGNVATFAIDRSPPQRFVPGPAEGARRAFDPVRSKILHDAQVEVLHSLDEPSSRRVGEILQHQLGGSVFTRELEGVAGDVFWPDGVVLAIRLVAEVGEREVGIRGVPCPNSHHSSLVQELLRSAQSKGKRGNCLKQKQ